MNSHVWYQIWLISESANSCEIDNIICSNVKLFILFGLEHLELQMVLLCNCRCMCVICSISLKWNFLEVAKEKSVGIYYIQVFCCIRKEITCIFPKIYMANISLRKVILHASKPTSSSIYTSYFF